MGRLINGICQGSCKEATQQGLSQPFEPEHDRLSSGRAMLATKPVRHSGRPRRRLTSSRVAACQATDLELAKLFKRMLVNRIMF